MSPLLTVTKYAQLVGLDPSVIRKRILAGKLKAVKYGKTWLIEKKNLPK